jgi:integrase
VTFRGKSRQAAYMIWCPHSAHTGDAMTANPRTLSEKAIADLPAPTTGNKVYPFGGATLQGRKAPAGFGVRVTSSGFVSFTQFYRAQGVKRLPTIGTWSGNSTGGTHTVLQAIIAARALLDEINRPGSTVDPRPARTRTLEDKDRPTGKTVADVLNEYFARHVEKDAKLRSAATIRSAFDRLVIPAIGGLGIYDVRRSDVATMLDDIADSSGAVMADRTLAYVRKAFRWFAARDDDFVPPIAPGMARVKPKDRARERVLDDGEIRAIWRNAHGVFGRFVKFLLLTGARRNEAAQMERNELSGSDWTLPAARNKTKVDLVRPLTKTAQELVSGEGRWIFTTDGQSPISGFSKFKRALDKASGVTEWTVHDLRRTARSLMSRAGVPSDHAERALGHVIGGVRGVYDRHQYRSEVLKAYEALDKLLARILKPAPNTVELAERRKAGR